MVACSTTACCLSWCTVGSYVFTNFNFSTLRTRSLVSHLRLTLRTVRMRVPPDDSTFLCLAVLTKRLCATCCCCCQNLLTLSKTEWSHPPSLVWCARACTAAAVRREGLYRVVPGAPSPPSSSSSSSYISLRHLHTLSAIAEHDQRNGKLLVQPLVPCWSKE